MKLLPMEVSTHIVVQDKNGKTEAIKEFKSNEVILVTLKQKEDGDHSIEGIWLTSPHGLGIMCKEIFLKLFETMKLNPEITLGAMYEILHHEYQSGSSAIVNEEY